MTHADTKDLTDRQLLERRFAPDPVPDDLEAPEAQDIIDEERRKLQRQ